MGLLDAGIVALLLVKLGINPLARYLRAAVDLHNNTPAPVADLQLQKIAFVSDGDLVASIKPTHHASPVAGSAAFALAGSFGSSIS